MDKSLHLLVARWLKKIGVSLSPNYVSEKLLSHAEFPSLSAITDMLDELAIEYRACVVDKDKLDEIPVPFLAHIKDKEEQFVLVTDNYYEKNKRSEFLSKWDGIILVAEPISGFKNEENENWIKKDRRSQMKKILLYAGILFFSLCTLFTIKAFFPVVILISGLLGFFLSVELVLYDMGLKSSVSNEFCDILKKNGCDSVLKQTHKPKFLGKINVSEIAMVWFCSVFLAELISLWGGTFGQTGTLINGFILLPLPLTFLSIFYQWRILKTLCLYCISIVGVTWLQSAVLLLFGNPLRFSSISPGAVFLTVFLFFIVSCVWGIVKSGIYDREKLRDELYLLRRFKNDPVVFESVLTKKRRSNLTPLVTDFQIGNTESPLQILVVCNPYCRPCSRAHFLLEKSTEAYKAGVTVRFILNERDEDNLKKDAAIYLYNVLEGKDSEYKKQVLNDWYTFMNMERFKEMYPLTSLVHGKEVIASLLEWGKNCMIKRTPTVFINGYEVTEPYSVFNLPPVSAMNGLLRATGIGVN